jgi:hypothetical protein
LADIKASTLIITGDKDIAIPRSNSDVIATKIPNSQLESISDAAHGFSYSHSDTTADLIHFFLQQPSHTEKMIMQDQCPAILTKFVEYAQTFNLLEPAKVAPFFHLPAMLMTSDLVAPMKTSDEVIVVFKTLMDKLKSDNFDRSEIIGNLQVTQVSDNQGIVNGVAKRFATGNKQIEHFGFTYTLRKVSDEWKIIIGVIHEPGTNSRSVSL